MKNWIWVTVFLSCVGGAIADDGRNLGLEGGRLGATQPFAGVVTALGPNADDPEHTFTAIADDGTAKVFRISSLKNLDVGDHVTLQYVEGDAYPMEVKAIQFHK